VDIGAGYGQTNWVFDWERGFQVEDGGAVQSGEGVGWIVCEVSCFISF